MNTDRHDLIQRHLAGITTDEEAAQLQDSLKRDDALAQLYLRYINLDVALEAQASSNASMRELLVSPTQSAAHSSTRWISWPSLAAAAAGIVLGIFCTSAVLAYIAPSWGKVTTLLQESFESGPGPLVVGAPIEVGHWSGDYSDVVGEQPEVKPESGKKMLRLLRTDYEGKPNAEGGHVGEIYRLIDMRPYREVFVDGGAVVQLSAMFNTFEFPTDERFECSLTLYALDAETATNGSTRSGIRPDEASLGEQKRRLNLDRSPATWQRLASELRLPPETDFLMLRICIQYAVKPASRQTFAGHYLDDVRLTMARRNPLP